MKNKLLSKVLLSASVLTLSLSSLTLAKSFNDIDSNHWAFKYVDELSNNGVINGYADGSFKPSGTITRAEFIKLLVASDEELMKMLDIMKSSNSFDNAKWYEPYLYVSRLYISIPFYNDDMLNSPINRSEVAYITACFLEYNEDKAKVRESKNNLGSDSVKYNEALRKANEKLKYINDKNLSDDDFMNKMFSLSKDKRDKLSEEAFKIVEASKPEAKVPEVTKAQKDVMILAWNKVLKELNLTKKDEDEKGIQRIVNSMSDDEYAEAHFRAAEEYFMMSNQVFNDIEDLNFKELLALVKVRDANIINGYEDGSFKPTGTLTRAEASKVLHEYIQNYKRLKGGK